MDLKDILMNWFFITGLVASVVVTVIDFVDVRRRSSNGTTRDIERRRDFIVNHLLPRAVCIAALLLSAIAYNHHLLRN